MTCLNLRVQKRKWIFVCNIRWQRGRLSTTSNTGQIEFEWHECWVPQLFIGQDLKLWHFQWKMYHFPGNGTIKKQVGSRRNLNLLPRKTLQHIGVCFRVPWCISLNLPVDSITLSPVFSIATRLLDICKCIRLPFLVLYLPHSVLMPMPMSHEKMEVSPTPHNSHCHF